MEREAERTPTEHGAPSEQSSTAELRGIAHLASVEIGKDECLQPLACIPRGSQNIRNELSRSERVMKPEEHIRSKFPGVLGLRRCHVR